MTIDSLGSLANLVIAMATVASLIYVATQIRENTSWSKRQALEKIIDRVIDWSARLNENPEILSIYLDGLTNFESLDDKSKHRYHYTLFELFVACEGVLEHAKTNSIKAETVDAINQRVKHELRGQGARDWWEEMGARHFAKDFASHVNRLLNEA